MAEIILHPDKERSVFRRHPWLFAGAVAHLKGRANPGDTVEVLAADGRPLGRAAWSPRSQVRARMWSFDPDETIDDAFFKRRIAASLARRTALPRLRGQEGLRLIHAESDGLPGVIADRYGDTVVLQLTSAGAEKWRRALVGALVKATGCARIYERSDSDVRGLEGLEPVTGWVHGEAPAAPLAIMENGVRLGIDVEAGHKTGFYLDQRDNRQLLGELSAGKTVLNCFSYTGGFSLQALAGGAAHVLGLASMIMGAGLDVRLRVLIPAVENSIGGNAMRPLDVVGTRKGLTVEIGNTDAEGRLVLCDALAEACRDKPDLLIDCATLTGAARVALGPDVPALFCNDDRLAAQILRQAAVESDPLWRLPLWRPYREDLKSEVADLSNVSEGPYAGAITAALYLRSALIATGVGLLAAVAPARRAAKLDPAEVIRYG